MPPLLTGIRRHGRRSLRVRAERVESKLWHIGQSAVAAGLAWFIAADLLGHPTPFFAPVAAIVSLGTTYGQRLRNVAEVTLGVAIGVLVGDLLVLRLGGGWWQLTLIVGLAMLVAFVLDGGKLFVTQAAVQATVVATLIPKSGAAWTRWTDALVGGGVALVAATIVPAAPLRRPRQQASTVVRKIADLLHAAGQVMETGEADRAVDILAEARDTHALVHELEEAADEGMSVVVSSPFRIQHRQGLRRMGEMVAPLDRALRNTRVLVRQTAVAATHGMVVPDSYGRLAIDVAEACRLATPELSETRLAAARRALIECARYSGRVERTRELNVEALLALVRSIIVDMLVLTGMDEEDAIQALPPPGPATP